MLVGQRHLCGRRINLHHQEDPRPPGSRRGPTKVGGAAASGSPGRSYRAQLQPGRERCARLMSVLEGLGCTGCVLGIAARTYRA